MKKNSTTNPVTDFIEKSVQKRFESLESLRGVSKEVFNIDEAFFRASLIRNTLHLLASIGHIKFESEETQQAFFQSVDMLQVLTSKLFEGQDKGISGWCSASLGSD